MIELFKSSFGLETKSCIGDFIIMKQWLKWCLLGIVILLAVAGGPIIINRLYQCNNGYITIWNAENVLSYYGTILAACIGIVGVYATVAISNKNYREDARNRILPYIGVNILNIRQPNPFLEGMGTETYATMGNNPIIEDNLLGKTPNHLFFVLDGNKKVRTTDLLHEDEAQKWKRTEVQWIRAAKDGQMYLRYSEYVSMPFTIENIGNGPAKKLRMSCYSNPKKPFFSPEIILKPNQLFYIHIFSDKNFETIKGRYFFELYYEDIIGDRYRQCFPIEIVKENGKQYERINTEGTQQLLGSAKRK